MSPAGYQSVMVVLPWAGASAGSSARVATTSHVTRLMGVPLGARCGRRASAPGDGGTLGRRPGSRQGRSAGGPARPSLDFTIEALYCLAASPRPSGTADAEVGSTHGRLGDPRARSPARAGAAGDAGELDVPPARLAAPGR